jgi:hypothetical protein
MKRSTTLLLFLFALLIMPTLARAQAPNIVQYDMQIFAPGVNTTTGSPVQTNTYQVSNVVCNQSPLSVTGTTMNPTRFEVDDAANAGKVCTGTLTSVLLPSLPNGVGYQATMTQTDNLGQTSPRSGPSNSFGKQGVPAAPTGFKLAGS